MSFSLRVLFVAFLAVLTAVSAFGQFATTGSILGLVKDPSGALVPNAEVVCISADTGNRVETKSTEAGAYVCPSLVQGMYRVEVIAVGFIRSIANDIKVDVASPTTLDVTLKIGSTGESVVVQAEATPVVTSTTAITTTVTGRQILELPLPTRSALDLAFQMPGASGGGNARYASFDDLPHGALNVSVDGVNTQDNLYKSYSGGAFYTWITPRVDAIDEVTVSSAANSASTSEGAVQIQFVTKRGTNDWHGGGFEYLRNNVLNANTWFNNKNGLPRQILKMNQFGGRLGGPILKNKLFIFGMWDDYQLPAAISRTRTVLNSAAIAGNFTYKGTDSVNHVVNVLQVAAANGFRGTPDATINGLLRKIDALSSSGQVGITPLNLYENSMTFNNPGTQRRYFPTTRLDYVINDRMQLDIEWYYQGFRSNPDLLNGYDRSYPGFETLNGQPAQGSQNSDRHQSSASWRWTLTPTITNEFRFGENGGTVIFAGGMNGSLYPGNTRLGFPLNLTSPLNLARDSRRNTPLQVYADTLSWQKGKHTLNFGGSFTHITSWDSSLNTAIPLASTGITSNDPVSSIFNATNFPAISNNDITTLQSLYALLTGRLSGVAGVVQVDEKTRQYVQFGPLTQRLLQRQLGIFFTDNFRLASTVTLNYGLRWDYQGVPTNTNGIYTAPQGGLAGVYGPSGLGNLFQPGNLPGQATQFVLAGPPYDQRFTNFAPNVGVAWSPNSENKIIKAVFGKGGAFRVGYSINYSREGLYNLRSFYGSNPGPSASAQLVAGRDFKEGTLFYDQTLPPLNTKPTSFTFPLPLSTFTYTSSAQVNAFAPGLAPPRVHSWSAGIQRELVKNTVLEVRYVGNYGQDLWRGINVNEVNIFENGFQKEFTNAQNNLTINQQNAKGNTFAFNSLPGQVALPIMTAAFKGTSGFTSSTFITYLQQGQAGNFANTLATSASGYMPNLITAGYPRNFFLANPDAAGGGAYLLKNGALSNYNSLQIEVRRRMSEGLLLSGSYVFAKGLTTAFADAIDNFAQPYTVRNFDLNYGPSPYDIRHTFKFNWIYELPFGRGKKYLTSTNGVLSRIFGGWQIAGIGRIQSGQPFQLTTGGTGGRATFNQNDAGVIPLVPVSQLQSMIQVVKGGNGVAYYVAPQLIGADGRANTQYLMPPTTPGQLGYNVLLYGPRLVRIDSTLAKKININERFNIELRAEALNVFNFINFMQASPSSSTSTANITSTSFGQTTQYYNDFNSSQDPGGRVLTLVFRLNF